MPSIIISLRQQVWCIGAFSSRGATYGSMIRAGNLTQRRREKQNRIRRGWVPQPLHYFTTPSYLALAAPCGLANPQGFHGAGLDLSIQAERSVGQGIALYPTYDWDASAAGDSARLSLQRSDMSIAARHLQSPRSRGAQCV
jgi:hypothetical protein